jgi:hypothetical protein
MATKQVNILGTIIGFTINATNIQNMLFMQKGDLFMEYVKSNKLMENASYPTLRVALERDLTIMAKEYDATGGSLPWGKMSIKQKSHSMAVSIYKTWQRRIVFIDDASIDKFEGKMFNKFDKTTNTEVTADRTVSKKTVFKSYDKKTALDFLNGFLNK